MKEKAKKEKEPYCTVELKRRFEHYWESGGRPTLEELDRIHKILKRCNEYNFLEEANFPATVVVLRGKNGEIAYTKGSEPGKYVLILEIPFSLRAQEKNNWVKIASRFFNPLLIADREVIQDCSRKRWEKIVKGQYDEYDYEMGNDNFWRNNANVAKGKIRSRTYAHRTKDYGEGSGLYKKLSKRDKEIKRAYEELNKLSDEELNNRLVAYKDKNEKADDMLPSNIDRKYKIAFLIRERLNEKNIPIKRQLKKADTKKDKNQIESELEDFIVERIRKLT